MNYKNLAFWIMMLFIFVLGIYLVWFVNSQGYSCISNPFVYGVSLQKDSGGEYTCSCSSPNSKPILVTKDGISLQESYYDWILPNDK